MNQKQSVLIILAGGKSSRMGNPKGLLKYDSTFWILSQLKRFSIGTPIYIGLGFEYQLYFDAIPWFKDALKKPILFEGKKVQIVVNPTPELGLFSNLQNVLKQVNSSRDIFVLPIDVPLLKTTELEELQKEQNEIVIPKHQGKKGHPVKLSSLFWNTLLEINPRDSDARLDIQIKKRNASGITIIEINDASILKNLNTPKDWHDFISN